MVLAATVVVVMAGCAGQAPGPDGGRMYTVRRARMAPTLTGQWDSEIWRGADTLTVDRFLAVEGVKERASDHRPVALARVLHDDTGLFLHFRVDDRYVRCVETEYHGRVWADAAVEFFVQPKSGRGYFNFEFNCGGTLLLSYHESPTWKGPSLREDGDVPWDLASRVAIYHSLPEVVDPEIKDDVTWQIECFIPFAVLETYVGPLGAVSGQTWRANFYKCAETNSHPHWAAWSPILEKFSFHQPRYFGVLAFD